MDVLDLLSHHLRSLDELGVTPFLPELISPVLLVKRFVLFQAPEDYCAILMFQQVDDFPGRKRLEIGNFF